jgi:AraC-like DNA-binding protein
LARKVLQKILFKASARDAGSKTQKELWIDSLSSGYARLNADPADDVLFDGDLQIAVFNDASFGTIQGTVKSIARTAREITASDADNVVLLCNSGDKPIRILQGERTVTLDSGCATLIEQCEPSSISIDSGRCSLFAVQTRRSLVRARFSGLDDRFMAPIADDTPAIMLMRTYVAALLSRQETFGSLTQRFVPEHIADFIAAAVEPVDGLPADTSDGLRAARMAAIYRELERSVSEPGFSLPVLAQRLGMSRRYVQRLLAEGGTSFSEELMRRRLNRARHMLGSAGARSLNVAEIALECGFSDVPHFHRMFRRQFGETPGDVRSAALRRDPGSSR